MMQDNKSNSDNTPSTTLDDLTQYLFSFRYSGDDDDKTIEKYESAADGVLERYPWREVYASWFDYALRRCPTADDIARWEHLFWIYGGTDFPLSDPYPMLGYLLYRTAHTGEIIEDFDLRNLFDSIAVQMLQRLGILTVDDMDTYSADQDPAIIAAAQAWRDKLGPAPLQSPVPSV